MRAAALLCLLVPLAACESTSTPTAPKQAAPKQATPEPEATLPARPPAPPPAPAAWPYVAWDHAEAISFNDFDPRRGVPLRVVDDKGWSPHIAARKPLTAAQTRRALELFAVTEGQLEVSKCPFPRHAVVLFDHDEAVGSINVCFSCGDILSWPETPPSTLDTDTLLTRHEATMPQWDAFFREAGLAIKEWD
jgi:hypothetical protein